MNGRLYGLIGTITTHVCLCNPFWYFPFCLTVGFLLLSSDFLLDFYTILSLKMSIRPIGHAGSWPRTWALKKTWGWVAQNKLWFHSMFEASSGYMRSCLKNQGFALLWFVFPTTSYNFVTWTKIKLSSCFPLTAKVTQKEQPFLLWQQSDLWLPKPKPTKMWTCRVCHNASRVRMARWLVRKRGRVRRSKCRISLSGLLCQKRAFIL